ncbi:hypothetical protein Pla108_09280 [Botrimarina colliarenosi]|uniref:Porin n=1 Tax=Botrimarina colliarenosi TaxID=2528001 RepID=A0A5C6AIY7_9BACT|nr:DUF6666 family protein [Botrimarina colliarenosi]TWT99984.1 hypothetical protein Pla108_09280 [Botrimarina colliarenosi]
METTKNQYMPTTSFRAVMVLATIAIGPRAMAADDTSFVFSTLAAEQSSGVELCDYGCSPECADACGGGTGWFDELTFFGGIDGSKQPQDFGVNANLGGQAHANWGLPLSERLGLGLQIGQTLVASDNAVRVQELLGESTTRFQSYTTLGLFQRTDSGFSWGFTHDWLNEDSYDQFSLQQWRVRAAYDVSACDQFGITANIASGGDTGVYNSPTPATVRLEAIDQGHLYWRHWWPTGVQTTAWGGIAWGHGEDNVVTGASPRFGDSFLMGADILAPLNNYLAIYGETNLIFPADSGTVDAFLGIQFYPGGRVKCARRGQFSPLLPVATPTSFSTDLRMTGPT